MKICPTCRRTYTDETLVYCLDDGSILTLLHNPEVTRRIPSPRATNQMPTEILSPAMATYPAPKRGGNRWLVYAVIALLSIVVGGGVVALMRSGDKNERPQDLSASPTPQATANTKQTGVTKDDEVQRGDGNGSSPDHPKTGKEDSQPAITSSRQLVGTWRAKVSELGQNFEVSFRANDNGTYQYSARNARGQTVSDTGTWQYTDGILYQRFSNGASGRGSIEWVDGDTFELTIIDNGVPAYSGLKRRYYRVK